MQHRKVRAARAVHLHKTALRLVRDNQAVYAEDLNTAGMTRRPDRNRTRTGRVRSSERGPRQSGTEPLVCDAGWAALVRLLEGKAARYGRTVVKVGRWFPSSQLCSVCGVKDGRTASVRESTCPACGTCTTGT